MPRTRLAFVAMVILGASTSCLFRVPRPLLAMVTAPLLFAGLEFWGRWTYRIRLPYITCVAWITTAFLRQLGSLAAHSAIRMPEWDFAGFWLHARSALTGINFYLPGSARALAHEVAFSSEFLREIVDVGFWYPPPSMFFFLPAGLPHIQQALILWLALVLGCLAVSCFVLWRVFFPGTGVTHLVLCSTLVLACNGTYDTIDFGQTNFLLLLFVSLFLSAPDKGRAGVFLALATFVKPFVAVAGVIWFMPRRLRAITGFVATIGIMFVASAIAFGGRTFLHFFAGDKGVKPSWIYQEASNQSALGFLHRLAGSGSSCTGAQCIFTVPYLAFTAATTLLTLLALMRLRNSHDRRGIAVLILFALMVYPVSQTFYSVLMVPVLLILWRARDQFFGGWRTLALLAAVDYALLFEGAFLAYALTYAVVLSTVPWRLRSVELPKQTVLVTSAGVTGSVRED